MWPKVYYYNLAHSEMGYAATFHLPHYSEYDISAQDKGNHPAIISLFFQAL